MDDYEKRFVLFRETGGQKATLHSTDPQPDTQSHFPPKVLPKTKAGQNISKERNLFWQRSTIVMRL